MTIALQTRNLVRRFGGLVATNDVSISLERGARHALIGPNGAGKTTLINLLTGVLTPTSGTIELDGHDISNTSRARRVELGMVRTFQINQLFPGFTPLQTVGLAVSRRLGLDRNMFRRIGSDKRVVEGCVDVLERFDLIDVMNRQVNSLPYGKQRLLEIAVAVACGPRVLLLDEPAAGVPEGERGEIMDGLAALPEDVTVLLIEHDMDLVFRFASRISVLVQGGLLLEGTVAEVSTDPRVREVYLGDEAHG
jgi:branched-chain amino acid transport system ATP-binding protein